MPTATRPAPPFELDSRHEWHVAPDEDWRLATAGEADDGRCRRLVRRVRCPGRPVAALSRRRRRYREPMDLDGVSSWWLYCEDHLYGRWIERGRVVGWRVRTVA